MNSYIYRLCYQNYLRYVTSKLIIVYIICLVLKMLAVMSEQSPDTTRDVTQDFLTTGRAGRRNALPDILGEHALTSTSDLPERLKNLTTAGTIFVHIQYIVIHCSK